MVSFLSSSFLISYLRERFFFVKHVNETEDKDGGHVHRQRDEEHEEVAVVPAADAVVYPRAMVIEDLKYLKLHYAR